MNPVIILNSPDNNADKVIKVDLRTGEASSHDKTYIAYLIKKGHNFGNIELSGNTINVIKKVPFNDEIMHLLIANQTYGVYISNSGHISVFNIDSIRNWGHSGDAIFDTSDVHHPAQKILAKMRMLKIDQNLIPLNSEDCICVVDGINYDKNKLHESANILYLSCRYIADEILDIQNIEYICASGIESSQPFKLNAPNLKYISKMGFYNAKVNELSIPNIEYIGSSSFYNTMIKYLVIPDGCVIGNEAFSCCRQLEDITFLGSVKVLKNKVFASCPKLRSVEIPYGCTQIDSEAFINCRNLTSVKIPDTVKNFAGANVFIGCNRLEELVLPRSIQTIYDYNFNKINSLKHLAVPKKLYKSLKLPENCKVELY